MLNEYGQPLFEISSHSEIRRVIERLITFENNATQLIFQEIFGERIGNHLWDKYVNSRAYSILWLYCYLDDGNRDLLVKHLSTM